MIYYPAVGFRIQKRNIFYKWAPVSSEWRVGSFKEAENFLWKM